MSRIAFVWCIAFAIAPTSIALASPPNIQTPAPIIHLVDNLDEADNLGWCIDTVGRGLSDRLHAHSCKPQGGDVQFRFDENTRQIISVAYDDKCAAYDGANGQMGLIDCDPSSSAQRFTYDAQTMNLQPEALPDACLTVGDQSRSAGPFMSRDLLVQNCTDTASALKSWAIKP